MTEQEKEDQRFKTMRHIETVRNCLNEVVREFLFRSELHDQSKLQSPEREMFDEWTGKLRGSTYGSPEYKEMLNEMAKTALKHHYENNRHHPQFHKNGIKGMTLIDLIEMFVDWYAATKRHADGDIFKSIEINQKRDGYSDELKQIFKNTAEWIVFRDMPNHANES